MTGHDDRPEDTCRFCGIAAGEIQPGVIVHSNRDAVAFPAMHQRPRNEGHILVVTRRHVTDLTALGVDSDTGVMQMLVTVAAALEREGAAGSTVIQHNGAAGGQDTFHLHLHVVPATTTTASTKIQSRGRAAWRECPRSVSSNKSAAFARSFGRAPTGTDQPASTSSTPSLLACASPNDALNRSGC